MHRVLGLVPYRLGTAGGQRTTVESWAGTLAEDGIEINLVPFETGGLHRNKYRAGRTASKAVGVLAGFARRIQAMNDLSEFDAVLVYREAGLLGPEVLERWSVHKGLPLIYCLDDPLFVPYKSPTSGLVSRLKFPAKVARICSIANLVIVNSREIELFANLHNSNVRRIPSLVDEQLYFPLDRNSRDRVCLGWSGSSSSEFNLDALEGPIDELARRCRFDLRLIGGSRVQLGGVGCVSIPWSAQSEVADLRRFDIGLVPMADHPWNKWKFSLKLAQFMALGIPTVCSPIGSIPEQIEHGVTGFLAEDRDKWVLHLETLIGDRRLRQTIGAAAAEFARTHFTVSANRTSIIEAFRSVLPR